MIIRCPQCEHARTINESKIPATAELATCPKCKHRFRFRTLARAVDSENSASAAPPSRGRNAPGPSTDLISMARENADAPRGRAEVQFPQGAVRETVSHDIWDAVDSLHHRWQTQMDQHVTEVETPRPAARIAAKDTSSRQTADTSPTTGEASFSEPADSKPHSLRNIPLQVDDASSVSHTSHTSIDAQPMAAAIAYSSTPSVFPYAEDGPPPEQRVERDMLLLKDSSERPMRDLGKLDEFGGFTQPDSAGTSSSGSTPDSGAYSGQHSGQNATPGAATQGTAQAPRRVQVTASFSDDSDLDDAYDNNDAEQDFLQSESAIPWENPAKHGWFRAFMDTLHGAMFAGPAFFSRFTAAGSLAPGYLFFLLMGYIAILGSVIWAQATTLLLPMAEPLTSHRVGLPVLLLLAPIALGLMQLFVTSCIRIVLQLFAPSEANFPLIYKVVSYSVAPLVLSIVPFVGPVVGALWFLASLITGCRNALGVSWRLAVMAPLPPALLLLSSMVWYFL